MPKTLFIESTPDIAASGRKVHGPSDIRSGQHGAVAADAIPKLIEGTTPSSTRDLTSTRRR